MNLIDLNNYYTSSNKTDQYSLPPKKSNTFQFENGSSSVRNQDKENDLRLKLKNGGSQQGIKDEDFGSEEYRRTSVKAYTQTANRYGYGYPDASASPMNGNLSQNMMNGDGNTLCISFLL